MERLERLRGRSRELLGGVVSPRDLDLFELRLERWLPDLAEGLALPYGPGVESEEVLDRLLSVMCSRDQCRPEELKRLDLRRQLRADWFQNQAMIGYVCYADRARWSKTFRKPRTETQNRQPIRSANNAGG